MQINTSTLITKSTKDVQGPHLVVSSGPTPNTRISTTESEPDRLRAVQVLYGDDGVPITASRSVNQTKWGFCKKIRGQYISTERLKDAKRIQRFQKYNPWREKSPKLTIKFALKSVEPVNVQQVVEATQDLWKWSCRECHTSNYASKPTKTTHYKYNLTAEKASFALWLAFDSPWLAPIKYWKKTCEWRIITRNYITYERSDGTCQMSCLRSFLSSKIRKLPFIENDASWAAGWLSNFRPLS